MIRLIDANNAVRRRLETDTSGFVLRGIYNDVMSNPNDTHVFVWDGVNGNARRRAIYPDYKGNREAPSENIFASFELLQHVLLYAPVIQVRVPEYEADDVVATMCASLQDKNQVHLVTNDADYLQLCVHPNVTIDRDPKADVPNHLIRLYKTLVGDTSDNIKGVKGFGEKAWTECDQEGLLKWISTGGDSHPDWNDFNISKRAHAGLSEAFESGLLRTLWEITGFYAVPGDVVTANMVPGKSDEAKVETLLSTYMQ